MKLTDIGELLLLAALWGGSFLFMRVAAPSLGPVWLIESRVLLAGLALLPMLVRLGLVSELTHHWRSLLVVGVLNSALPFLLYAFASLFLPAGFTAILNATAPLFGMVVAGLWLKERLTGPRLIGFCLGFVGVVILVGWQGLDATPAFIMAVVAGLIAALMYAIAAPYMKQNLKGVSSLTVTTGSQLGAALVIFPALPFTVPSQPPTLLVGLTVLALALFSTAGAYILYFRLINHVGSTRALTVTYLIPVFAMIWGAIALQETITVSMMVGCGFVLLGTAIANGLLSTWNVRS